MSKKQSVLKISLAFATLGMLACNNNSPNREKGSIDLSPTSRLSVNDLQINDDPNATELDKTQIPVGEYQLKHIQYTYQTAGDDKVIVGLRHSVRTETIDPKKDVVSAGSQFPSSKSTPVHAKFEVPLSVSSQANDQTQADKTITTVSSVKSSCIYDFTIESGSKITWQCTPAPLDPKPEGNLLFDRLKKNFVVNYVADPKIPPITSIKVVNRTQTKQFELFYTFSDANGSIKARLVYGSKGLQLRTLPIAPRGQIKGLSDLPAGNYKLSKIEFSTITPAGEQASAIHNLKNPGKLVAKDDSFNSSTFSAKDKNDFVIYPTITINDKKITGSVGLIYSLSTGSDGKITWKLSSDEKVVKPGDHNLTIGRPKVLGDGVTYDPDVVNNPSLDGNNIVFELRRHDFGNKQLLKVTYTVTPAAGAATPAATK